MADQQYSLMIHGGAGDLDDLTDEQEAAPYLASIESVLESSRQLLEKKGSALDAVTLCASMLEDDPLFNAGTGSVLNRDGKVEMDAAIMCGTQLNAGAVAAIRNIANPIQLARKVLEAEDYVLLAGEGALRFAQTQGMEQVPDSYFLTPERAAQWKQLNPGQDLNGSDTGKFGTIGAVARDRQGQLAAATSTGGRLNKDFGRVGDSPIIGAGVYADNETCAVSCTGQGEAFIRTVLAKTISDLMLYRGFASEQAVSAAMDLLQQRVGGFGGLILIDKSGRCISGFNTKCMVRGWIEKNSEAFCRL